MGGNVAAKSPTHPGSHATHGKAPSGRPVIPMKELGWSKAQIAEARRRLSSFEKEWEGENAAEDSP